MAETSASKLSKRIHTDGSTIYKSGSAPSSPVEGDLWYNTTTNSLQVHNGTSFGPVSAAVPTLTGVTGTIVAGIAGDGLTLAGTNFLAANLVVNFVQAGDSIDVNVTVTPSSDTAASVTIPSSIYSNVTAGNVVTVKVTNSDNASSSTQTTTAAAQPIEVEYLVVAGGGTGAPGSSNGGYGGGGGGAGGYRTNYGGTKLSFTAGQVYTVTVGDGGPQIAFDTDTSSTHDGDDSVLSGSGITTITSTGGGAGGHGGSTTALPGRPGGSGGGGGSGQGDAGGSGNTPSTSPLQGRDGGQGHGSGPPYSAGGGGGHSVAGHHGQSQHGLGGNGTANSITGASVTYAGGGGGGTWSDSSISGAAAGGSGGGGAGQDKNGTRSVAGTANLGGGGGGGGASTPSSTGTGAAGGKGVVILRLLTSVYTGTTSGSPTVTTDGSHKVIKFTSSGSYTA